MCAPSMLLLRSGAMCFNLQAVRNESDLKAMAVPPKYQKMNTFYKYVRLSDCFFVYIL